MTSPATPPARRSALGRAEHATELALFAGRWLIAPCYFGLLVVVGLITVKFAQELAHAVPAILTLSDADLVLLVLTLIDLTLAGNLLIMVAFAGYENFVSRIDTAGHEDRPDWMGHVDFSGLKLKLIGSIVAISAIHLLKTFMNIRDVPQPQVAWQLAIHLGFVVSGVLLAWMDRLGRNHDRE